jgi:DNA-binding MarR family transcriptional regulator
MLSAVARSAHAEAPSPPDAAGAERRDFDAAWDELVVAMRRARGQVAAEIEKDGMSLAQYRLLSAFDAEGTAGMSVGALADAAAVAQPTATRMLDGLERAGVIRRRPSNADRRCVTVELTPHGRKLLRRKEKQVAERRAAVYESLPPGDRARASELLRTMAAAIGQPR